MTRRSPDTLPHRRHLPIAGAPELDAVGLARALAGRLEGEVRFDAGARALYATDASNYRQLPIGVVVPRSADDVVAAVDLCRRFGAPLLGRGGGTSLAGQCCNHGVVVDFSKYMGRILDLDPERRLARVEPGVVLDDLRGQAERHHLTFGPDPATHNRCTLGGMLGNNSCGVHALMAGKTADNTESLEILTYDGLRLRVGATGEEELQAIVAAGGRRGEIYGRLRALRDRHAERIRAGFPDIPRRVSGYNLDQLLPERGFHVARALVGSESTCVTVLEATLRLIPSPRRRVLALLGFADVFAAADAVPEVLRAGPIGLEGIDEALVTLMRRRHLHLEALPCLPGGQGWLLVEFGGDTLGEAEAKATALVAAMRAATVDANVHVDPREQQKIWEIRESGLGATARVPGKPDAWPGWEDSAVAPEDLGRYLRDLRRLMDEYGYEAALYGHFGQGCVHCRITFDLKSHEGIRRYRRFVEDAARLVAGHGGSLSGEHGDGQSRGELLPIMFGDPLVEAFREFKAIWDPAGKMNPGKVVDPLPLDHDLRLGVDYEPRLPGLHIGLQGDGSFARATTRCVGVGLCRKEHTGTMCPSYMVTREEMHSTRGRAHLLFEALSRPPLVGRGLHDRHVKAALDLCLACKACKSECPVSVDMATYKAEFLAHYYRGRVRPPAALAFGFIDLWSRLAARAPGLANFALHRRPFAPALKRIVGVAPRREMPRYAAQTFRRWFEGRGDRPRGGAARVILWADTFNNFFHPEVAIAAVRALEGIGYRVALSPPICCGRPLYDFGYLGVARRRLRRIVAAMRGEIRAGTPVVGLEPSCVSVFRDELPALLDGDEDAARLRDQTSTLAEFLVHGPLRADLHLGGRSSTATATTRRSSASPASPGSSARSACRSRSSTPAAAGWPAPSASTATPSTCRWRPASGCSCPPSAGPTPRR